MRVRAKALGFHVDRLYSPGDVFDIDWRPGKPIPENAWFEEVPADTPGPANQGQETVLHDQWDPSGWKPARGRPGG